MNLENAPKAFGQEHLYSILRWIETLIFQHSAPFRRTLYTLLLKILILVRTLRLAALHTGFSMALLILLLTSWLQSQVVVTLVPIFVNSSTSYGCFPSIMTGSFNLVFFLRTRVFFVLTLRPNVLDVFIRRSAFDWHPGEYLTDDR